MLHHRVLQAQDRFILSKGHAAGALYVSLWSLGLLTDDDLLTFGQDASRLPGHPSGTGIPGLFSTGSLGHGPALAAGLALAARMQDSQRRVYCLCSDSEWQEGSCWEALTFAVHQRLDNLTIMVDQNGLPGFGTTQEVISCSDLSPRLLAFGAHVVRVDGHDTQALQSTLMTRLSGALTRAGDGYRQGARCALCRSSWIAPPALNPEPVRPGHGSTGQRNSMRKTLAAAIVAGCNTQQHFFLTGDPGFMALEEVRDAFGQR